MTVLLCCVILHLVCDCLKLFYLEAWTSTDAFFYVHQRQIGDHVKFSAEHLVHALPNSLCLPFELSKVTCNFLLKFRVVIVRLTFLGLVLLTELEIKGLVNISQVFL